MVDNSLTGQAVLYSPESKRGLFNNSFEDEKQKERLQRSNSLKRGNEISAKVGESPQNAEFMKKIADSFKTKVF